MTSIPIPVARARPRSATKWVLAATLLAGTVGAGFFLTARLKPAAQGMSADAFYTVSPMEMQVSITKDGELAAVNNVDIVSPIEGQGTIKTIVAEGSSVKKGDVLITMDASEIEKRLKEAQVNVEKAESDLTAAKEALVIQVSKNKTDLASAEVALELARLDQEEYEKGKYPALVRESKKNMEMATITLRKKREELIQSKLLYTRGFVTASQVEEADLAVKTAENDQDKKTSDLNVLVTYTYQKETKDKKNKVAEAEGKLNQVKTENQSVLAQKDADARAKAQTLVIQKDQLEKAQKQFTACSIKAPGDGLVIYGSSVRESWWRDRPITAGAQVREQELLIRLPDTSGMKVQTKIPESMVSKIRADKDKKMPANVLITGVGRPVSGWVSKISVLADNSQRWWNPDLKEYPVEVTLDETPGSLKPGTSASVTIDIERLPRALCVPMGALYSVGKTTYVFRRDGADARPQVIKLGQMNSTHAQVVEGINEGDQVALLQAGQGRELLERAGIKVETILAPGATTKPVEKAGVPTEAKPTAAPAPAGAKG
jgi:multidrug efflux pump subunit AcrA (membrane-fusion protein)